ncbi:MAG: 1,4-alpha-glucan branching enzyme GlgB [Desulfovibrio sp.]
MGTGSVLFVYHTGYPDAIFHTAILHGSWDADGRFSETWSAIPMEAFIDDAGCPAFKALVSFDIVENGKEFAWGVTLDAADRKNIWGVTIGNGATAPDNMPRRFFVLQGDVERQEYLALPQRYLGANKYFPEGGGEPGIRFTVWVPRAQKAELVVAAANSGGYIRDDGTGIHAVYSMTGDASGIWSTDVKDPAFADYAAWIDAPYMFRITRDDGSTAYRTDIYSRLQAGSGGVNPATGEWSGRAEDLECTKSCSVVADPDVSPDVADADPLRPVPTNVQDMVIYEMHIGALGGPGAPDAPGIPGTLDDAEAMLDYLSDLGVNAIELLPVSDFEGAAGWGYGSSHFYANKYDRTGRGKFKRFVRECHRRGMAVIVDVVYNHYSPDSERVHWMYDSARHDGNAYYYYHGKQEDYPEMPEGGYCDNYSTGYLPNVGEERVRAMMIGSAAALALDCRVDGFRMDLTQALHSFNVLHADGSPCAEANEAGIRFMREWVRTLRLFKPGLFLLAEDHSGWNKMAASPATGGIGFDATWWVDWYHQLVGDASQDSSRARLLVNAGYGTKAPLKMDAFAGMIPAAARRIVYSESHDEAGNSEGSRRNIEVAVNNMLFDNTRGWGEARCKVAAGVTLLAAGTPMFFMGGEVGAQKPYRHGDFLDNREDFASLRAGTGANLFAFHQGLIRLRHENPALRSPLAEVVKVHNRNRVILFRRWFGDEEFLVAVSFNNNALENYAFGHRALRGKKWKEIFSSDAACYGGGGLHNEGEADGTEGIVTLRIPANSVTVFARVN